MMQDRPECSAGNSIGTISETQRILERLEKVQAIAQETVNRADSKLSSIMYPHKQQTSGADKAEDRKPLPPFLENLRNGIENIEYKLSELNKMLDRIPF